MCAKKKGNPKVRGKCLGTGDMQRVPVFTRPKRARDGGGEGGGGGGGASAAAPATTSPKGTKRQPGSMQVGDSVSFYELQSGKAGSYYGAQHCRSQMGKDGVANVSKMVGGDKKAGRKRSKKHAVHSTGRSWNCRAATVARWCEKHLKSISCTTHITMGMAAEGAKALAEIKKGKKGKKGKGGAASS